MNQLIKVTQLPVIEEQLRSLGAEIDKQVAEATALVCTEDTVKDVKKVRTSLNNKLEELEKQRKAVKAAVLDPYNAFEAVYKECVSSKFKSADSDLKAKIDDVESGLKLEKLNEIKAYFTEYAESLHLDWLTIDRAGLNVTLSATVTALKKQAASFIACVDCDVTAIEAMSDSTEILVEYKRCLNLSNAMIVVSERHRLLDQESAKKAELETVKQADQVIEKAVEAFAPPVVVAPVDDLVMVLSFKVKATKSKLKLLKQFLEDGGYEIVN